MCRQSRLTSQRKPSRTVVKKGARHGFESAGRPIASTALLLALASAKDPGTRSLVADFATPAKEAARVAANKRKEVAGRVKAVDSATQSRGSCGPRPCSYRGRIVHD